MTVFDPQRVLSSPLALDAFRVLTAAAREAGRDFNGDDHPLGGLARGAPVTRAALEQLLGATRVEALAGCGAFELGESAVPSFGLAVTGRVVVPVPLDTSPMDDVVYIGADSASLVEAMWLRAPGGERAVDLGSGTGFLAAVLTSRYEFVVATELVARGAAASALTLAINPPSKAGHRSAVCITDVATGIRPESFDLVTVNPPWVPDPPDAARPKHVFAHGGPTGFELPQRFISEGAGLLRPGGILVMVTLDATYRDGSRPLHEICPALEARGFETTIEPTRLNESDKGFEDRITTRSPQITAARHAALVVRAPPTSVSLAGFGTTEELP